MRILYLAIDQQVPGTTGGAIHVAAVAAGLAALGHEVHVVTRPGAPGFPGGPVRWHAMAPPLGFRQLRLARAHRVRTLARRIRPDVVIERYYNLGGEGIGAARAHGAVMVLEVNSTMRDHPESPKRWLDRALLVEPLRRWRDWQAGAADLIVTPAATVVPPWVARDRIVETEWGADTERFTPEATGPVPFTRAPGDTVAIFAGAFRTWHGTIRLVHAAARLRARGHRRLKVVLVGEGPELPRVQRAAAGLDGVTFTGPLPHDRLPAALAAADIGVAPFDVAAYPPLRLEFFWSPLKIFEYMAAGLPVVAPALPRLRYLIGEGGLLYDSADPDALARALETLCDPARRAILGRAARARVVQRFSWTAHCRLLDAAIRRARAERVDPSAHDAGSGKNSGESSGPFG